MANPLDITVLSLCTGYGGLELGLALALANPLRVVAVEIEAYALANLVAKAEEGKLAIEALYPDLRTFPAERFRGCFDFILAGYPCQPFSIAGQHKGNEDPRHLWPYICQHIKAIRPIWVFCENVSGHFNLGFDQVYRSLAGMDYAVEAGLFSAAECMATHKRQRLYFLAHSQGKCSIKVKSKPERATGIQWGDGREMCGDWPPGPKQVSKIPREDDGCAYQLDRLRLLGNGVIPQQAAKAFRALWETVNQK